MKTYASFAALALVAAVTGCQSSSKSASTKAPLNPAVTDISPTPPTSSYSPPIQPVQPVVAAQPVDSTPAQASFAAPAGGKYTVQKGDTLFKIAREHYGDGKQWNRIVAANPGLSPQNLKAGQKIVVP
jgi:nucleoid-associated protein YgaU